jgi:hypothetical protein
MSVIECLHIKKEGAELLLFFMFIYVCDYFMAPARSFRNLSTFCDISF